MPFDLREKAKSRLQRERGSVPIDRAAPVRLAIVFPNTYRVGMASLGYQLVYRILNALPNASCERAFLPDDDGMAEHVRTRTELFTIESQSPLAEFDVVAFSLSYELDYLNVLRALRLANIPVLRSERDETRPLVIAGGPCAVINPEPLADFIDAFVIGDAEPVLPVLADALERTAGMPCGDVLSALADLPGVYVPALAKERGRVQRSVALDLARYPASSAIGTGEAEFGDIELVEIARGCARRCRFCAAGHIYRPYRPRDVEIGAGENRVGLVGAAVFDHPDASSLCGSIVDAGREFSVSSLRLETITPEVAAVLAAGRQRTLTVAPEAGSERLRKVINKSVSDEKVESAVRAASNAGIQRIRLYFMVGLPTETDEDVEAISCLVRRLAAEFPEVRLLASVSVFVPKPWTPFQWHPMEREEVAKRRLALLKSALKGVRGVELSTESPRLALIQALLTRGDSGVASVLLEALDNGGDYQAAIRATGIDLDEVVYRQRGFDEHLPWEVVDCGIDKAELWREYQAALTAAVTE